MRVNRDWLDCVAFICIDSGIEGSKKIKPIATAFFVRIPDELDNDISSVYLVTAGHVIEEVQDENIYLRINNVDGGFSDHPTKRDDWSVSNSADVAAYLIQPPVKFAERNVNISYKAIAPSIFIDENYAFPAIKAKEGTFFVPVEVGHNVFFIGLFIQTYGKMRNSPIVRFGHISRMPGEMITLPRWGGTSAFDTIAYLVECHSWGGP